MRILILEDNPADAELAVRELKRESICCMWERVETKDDFLNRLDQFAPDVILSDYSLPQFTGLEALRLLKGRNDTTPFILCTGSLTEEVAVQCMREGAADYVLKSSLKRLPSAVMNALEASRARRAMDEALVALKESEEKFRSIVETTNEWIWAADADGRITYSNPAVRLILGISPDEMIGSNAFDHVHEDDRQIAMDMVREAINNDRGWSQIVIRFLDAKGQVRYLESNAVPVPDGEGTVAGFRGTNRDITERRRAEEQLLHDAFHDGLTGLANRKLFLEHLRLTIDRGRSRYSNPFALLFLDFDRFKVINDSLGHAEGDKLLRMIARRLESATRTGDLVARLGGDEFVILLCELSDGGEALLVADRILSDLRQPFNLSGRDVYMTTSIGIARSSSGYVDAEDMIRDADIAMYEAKACGRAQFQIFDNEMHAQASRKLRIETDLRTALEQGEFCLHYQPIVHLRSGALTGFEALIRWRHPERGMITPNEFIPTAEDNGLILELGQWAVEEGCRQMREWQLDRAEAGGLTVAINLSGKEFRQPDLADKIAASLAKTGLMPECLKLEITESHVMENSEAAITTMSRLRWLGVDLSLDDFGTGYSSLSYLHRLPFSYLKIDRSFTSTMMDCGENFEIINTIIKLGKNLKMKVIAEGVETRQQADRLIELDCDYGQGYHFSKPMSAADAGRFIREAMGPDPARTGETLPESVLTY